MKAVLLWVKCCPTALQRNGSRKEESVNAANLALTCFTKLFLLLVFFFFRLKAIAHLIGYSIVKL